jgi:hypothetical protein
MVGSILFLSMAQPLRGGTALRIMRDPRPTRVRQESPAQRLSIHAVSCFILDHDYAISGAQEPEIFLPLLDLAAAAVC